MYTHTRVLAAIAGPRIVCCHYIHISVLLQTWQPGFFAGVRGMHMRTPWGQPWKMNSTIFPYTHTIDQIAITPPPPAVFIILHSIQTVAVAAVQLTCTRFYRFFVCAVCVLCSVLGFVLAAAAATCAESDMSRGRCCCRCATLGITHKREILKKKIIIIYFLFRPWVPRNTPSVPRTLHNCVCVL